eukprot:TRINITY_DN446_c0_g3_i1.p1 TRINITY_DN446_c0_g3~~TRINITY_DN446_c0_g3_i1.p1  ORF type:complete len:138 (+),score=48.00 TRINITY_DN446_c0_g3_i1:95-508(+)
MGKSIRSKKKKAFRTIKRQRLQVWAEKNIERKHEKLLAIAQMMDTNEGETAKENKSEGTTTTTTTEVKAQAKPRREKVSVVMDVEEEETSKNPVPMVAESSITAAKTKRRENINQKIGTRAVKRRREMQKNKMAQDS